MESYSAGIDFGTCSIKVAYYNEATKKVKSLKLDKDQMNHDNRIPNVIEYKGRGDFTVGERARKQKVLNSANVVEQIKRKLEYEEWSQEFPELRFALSATDIATDIFSWVKSRIESLGKQLDSAVITLPVCFSEIQKERVISSAKKAGIPVKGTLTEPVAALFAMDELLDEECEEDVVVVDFGGATLDLCLFHIESNGAGESNITIQASCGMDLGGVDITNLIYEEILKKKYGDFIEKEIQDDRLNRVEKEFRDLAERMKEDLFEQEGESVSEFYASPNNPSSSLDTELELSETIECFNRHQIREKVTALLDELFMESDEIDREDVTMVRTFGGTSRITWFREILDDYFGSDVFDMDEYDSEDAYQAVAEGAAKYLNVISDPDSQIRITNSIPFYIGINVEGNFRALIQRNQKYGVMSPYKSIARKELEEWGWKFRLYQSFERKHIEIFGENGAVYMGCIELDKRLYDGADAMLYKMGVNQKGKTVGQFFVTDEENNPSMVEEKEIVIGG